MIDDNDFFKIKCDRNIELLIYSVLNRASKGAKVSKRYEIVSVMIEYLKKSKDLKKNLEIN